jgi:hypothetical protein
MVGVNERNVSLENHYKVVTLDDHYVYHICWLVFFIWSLDTHIFHG